MFKDRCDASQIGYTINALFTTIKQHKCHSSKISRHYMDNHNKNQEIKFVGAYFIYP